MALFYPSNPPTDRLDDRRYDGEIAVWRSLEDLDDSWRIFYSVRWQSVRNGRVGDGESDFVLVHPTEGILVLEVKGGRVAVLDGAWTSEDRYGKVHAIKNPFNQASDAKYLLIRKFEEIGVNPATRPGICHAVAFPHGDVGGSIGVQAPAEIIWSRRDLSNVDEALKKTLTYWRAKGRLSPSDLRKITNLLAPTTSVSTTLRGSIDAAERELIRLTRQQIEAMALLRQVRRALITGGPGTGKTILAVSKAKELASQGARVLLTCFNQPLGEHLARECHSSDNLTVSTFHGMCFAEARKAGIRIPDELDDRWWDLRAPELLLNAAQINKTSFDAVIVDEAQDFAEDWLAVLAMLLENSSDGFFFSFADKNQELYRRNWGPPELSTEFPLTINCRSTLEIVDRIQGIFGADLEGLGIRGPKPIFVSCKTESEVLSVSQETVARLISEESIDPSQIKVLCLDRSCLGQLRGRSVGICGLVEAGKTGVVVETVHRFKGLEADVIVLVLGTNDLSTAEQLMNAYVGASRARSLLIVIGNSTARKAMNWS